MSKEALLQPSKKKPNHQHTIKFEKKPCRRCYSAMTTHRYCDRCTDIIYGKGEK